MRSPQGLSYGAALRVRGAHADVITEELSMSPLATGWSRLRTWSASHGPELRLCVRSTFGSPTHRDTLRHFLTGYCGKTLLMRPYDWHCRRHWVTGADSQFCYPQSSRGNGHGKVDRQVLGEREARCRPAR